MEGEPRRRGSGKWNDTTGAPAAGWRASVRGQAPPRDTGLRRRPSPHIAPILSSSGRRQMSPMDRRRKIALGNKPHFTPLDLPQMGDAKNPADRVGSHMRATARRDHRLERRTRASPDGCRRKASEVQRPDRRGNRPCPTTAHQARPPAGAQSSGLATGQIASGIRKHGARTPSAVRRARALLQPPLTDDSRDGLVIRGAGRGWGHLQRCTSDKHGVKLPSGLALTVPVLTAGQREGHQVLLPHNWTRSIDQRG